MSRPGIISPRLVLALLAYAVLGFMAWRTMESNNFRLVTLVILAFFAARTVMHSFREQTTQPGGSERRQNDSE